MISEYVCDNCDINVGTIKLRIFLQTCYLSVDPCLPSEYVYMINYLIIMTFFSYLAT